MYLHRPKEDPSRGRFLLALTLSTVTAAAVAAPLALSAVRVDSTGPAGAPVNFTEQIDPLAPDEDNQTETGTDDKPMLPTTVPSEGRGSIAPVPTAEEATTTTVAVTTTSTVASTTSTAPTTTAGD